MSQSTALGTLKKLLGHIDGKSLQNDPVHLLVSVEREFVEQCWRVVHDEDRKAAAEKSQVTA